MNIQIHNSRVRSDACEIYDGLSEYMCVSVRVCDTERKNHLGPWPDKWKDKLAEHIYFVGWGTAFSLQNGCFLV